jgi:hypothetical protein
LAVGEPGMERFIKEAASDLASITRARTIEITVDDGVGEPLTTTISIRIAIIEQPLTADGTSLSEDR